MVLIKPEYNQCGYSHVNTTGNIFNNYSYNITFINLSKSLEILTSGMNKIPAACLWLCSIKSNGILGFYIRKVVVACKDALTGWVSLWWGIKGYKYAHNVLRRVWGGQLLRSSWPCFNTKRRVLCTMIPLITNLLRSSDRPIFRMGSLKLTYWHFYSETASWLLCLTIFCRRKQEGCHHRNGCRYPFTSYMPVHQQQSCWFESGVGVDYIPEGVDEILVYFS